MSLGGSVPSAACAAASAGDAPAAIASSTAFARSGVPPMFDERDRRSDGRAVVAVDERRDADRGPVLRAAVVLHGTTIPVEPPSFGTRISVSSSPWPTARLEDAGEEVGRRHRPLAACRRR